MSNVIQLSDSAGESARIVDQMAMHLVAGVTGGLDLKCECDVIQYLRETPERYRWNTIHRHLDAALYEARQTLIAAQMSRAG